MLGLVNGVLHAFQADLMAFAADMAGAVAGRPDMGIAGACILVHHDAVLHAEAGMDRQFVTGNHADAHQHDVGVIGQAAGAHPFHFSVAAKGFHPGIQHQLYARLAMLVGIEGGNLRRHRARHQPVHRLEHRHVQSALGADRRHLQPDIAAAHHGDALARLEDILQPVHIGDGLEIVDARQVGAGAFQAAHPRAGGQQQLVIGQRAAIGEFHAALGTMDRLGSGVQDQIAAIVGIIIVGLQEQARALELAQQIGLGQGRALIGRIGFVAHHGDGAGKALLAQRLESLTAGLAGADDDDVF